MRRKGQYFLALIIFLVLCVTINLFAKGKVLRPVIGGIQFVFLPVQRLVFSSFSIAYAGGESQNRKLQTENKRLSLEMVKYKEQEKEIAALKDQFKNSPVSTQNLLPAEIVGMRSFIPGFGRPVNVLLSKGRRDGVIVGMGVIIQDRVVGKITGVSERLSQMNLVTASGTVITAKTLDTNALGVIKGEDDDTMLLDNVLLSDKLTVGDTVITGGTIDDHGLGYPPGLILGKISSIDKKPSALFQTAEVQRPVDVTHEKMVFIILP
ncbi:hypothetical protein BH11PAT1_BH11PAT1_1730 [soil metagenome]